MISGATKRTTTKNFCRDAADLSQRLLVGSKEKVISEGMTLIQILVVNFYKLEDIVTVLDPLMELLLTNEVYAHKTNLKEDEKNYDMQFWNTYFAKHE